MFDDDGSVGRNSAPEAQLVKAAVRGGRRGEESEELLSPALVAVVPHWNAANVGTGK